MLKAAALIADKMVLATACEEVVQAVAVAINLCSVVILIKADCISSMFLHEPLGKWLDANGGSGGDH